MIKTLFLPERISNKPLFSRSIAGISIEQNAVHLALLSETRNGFTIDELREFPINPGEAHTFNQRAVTALKKAASFTIDKDEVRVALSASQVTMKEISVPFSDPEKIRMVIDYEVESVLPFALEEALIDFIVLSSSAVTGSSKVLVAAARTNDVKKEIEFYKKAGITPTTITIDLLGMYGLYAAHPAYEKKQKEAALITVSENKTVVAFVDKNHLSFSRTIPHGISENGASENLESQVATLFDHIQFTLNSFGLKKENGLALDHIVCVGAPEKLSPLIARIKEALHITVKSFETEKLIGTPLISSKLSTDQEKWRLYTRAIAIGYTELSQLPFNLRRKEMAISSRPALKVHVLTIIGLFIALFAGIGFSGYWHITTLTQLVKKAEDAQIKLLKPVLKGAKQESGKKKKKSKKGGTLRSVIKQATQATEDQEEMWAPFSQQRLRPLEIMQELTNIINRKKYDVTIEQVLISDEEHESNPIQVQGFFKSKTGSEHFKYWSLLEQEFKNSEVLVLSEEIDPTPAEEGVHFVAYLKQKDSAHTAQEEK